jgi:hypothetical protein
MFTPLKKLTSIWLESIKPSALENVKDVKEELLNAFGCILVSWDDILLIIRTFNDGSFENILLN